MTPRHPALLIVVATVLAACRPGLVDDASTSQDSQLEEAEVPDTDEDPWKCGELGLVCVGPLGIGECVDGACQGRLSSCYPPAMTCAEICGELDAACLEHGCEGATAWVWDAPTQEEADYLCVSGHRDSAQALSIGCEDDLTGLAKRVNCCCQW